MLDGGRQLQIFLRIVVPITTPVTMTVALFQIFAYWNSWYPALLYLDSNHTELYPLQYVLVNMQRSIDMLANDAQYISGAQAYIPPAVTVRMVLVVDCGAAGHHHIPILPEIPEKWNDGRSSERMMRERDEREMNNAGSRLGSRVYLDPCDACVSSVFL